MFELLGDVERGISALYPYRVPLTAGVLVTVLAAAAVAWRRGWIAAVARVARRRPAASAALLVLAVMVTVPAGWYLASPLWTRTMLVEASPLEVAREAQSVPASSSEVGASPTPPTVAPTSSADPASVPSVPREVRQGEWIGADDFHFAEGRALIIETEPGRYILRVEDFSVRNGPDLFVYLSPSPDGFAEGGLNLGELKATDGAFNYEVPDGTDLTAYRSAVVWCERFAVLFATATLDP